MPPRVFVSYCHDSDEHSARIVDLVLRLRSDGFAVVYDVDIATVGGPAEGWPRWCERQIVECDFVLACCSVLFHQRFDGTQNRGAGHGVSWEASFIRDYLYDNPDENRKIRPIIFHEDDRCHIPKALVKFSHFSPFDETSYSNLLGWMKSHILPPPTSIAVATGGEIEWPMPSANFQRRLADRHVEFDRLSHMLAGRSGHRILLAQGPSGSGKTALIHECVTYARHQKVLCSHIDLKGALPLEDVFQTLIIDVGEKSLQNACNADVSARGHKVLVDLQQLRQPLFLALDTYEDASQISQSWIEMLLSRMDLCPALVVSIAGQRIPGHSGRAWASLAHAVSLPPIPKADDWVDFIHRRYGATSVTRDHVEAYTIALDGDPSGISTMINALVNRLSPA